MKNYWIGIVGSVQAVLNFEERPWWCFPVTAKKGDVILLYCPRSVSDKNQGIFGLANIKEPIDQNHENNYYCTGFGRNFGRGRPLFYGELKFQKRYKMTLTAKEMKKDHLLGRSNFVRRNFQGTTFKVDEEYFNRIKELITEKNK